MSRLRNRLSVFSGTIVCLFLACNNPFFPSTGIPLQANASRATPSGVVDQLITSYKLKNLALFKDLFPKDRTFQFYVAPSFGGVNESNNNLPLEPRDTTLHNIGEASQYYYWDQDAEESSHQNLFYKASELEFSSKPIISEIRYIKNEAGDTVKAEVVLTGGEFIVSGVTPRNEVITDQPVSIEKQVFLMVKNDDDHLWVIKKWYDLSNPEPASDY